MKRYLFTVSILFSYYSYSQTIIPGSEFDNYRSIFNLKNDHLSKGYILDEAIDFQTDSVNWNLWSQYFHELPDKNNFTVFAPEIKVSLNTSYPRGYNDGPVWKGRGLTSEIHGGFTAKNGILHLAFIPVFYFSQNLDFTLAEVQGDRNPFNYQFGGGIDYVQRFGTSAFSKFHPGQSEIRLIWRKATIGVSTKNFSLGPARYNPILMSKNGPGFPHVDIGTYEPIDLQIKDVELGSLYGRVYYGLLNESEYFDEDTENDQRYFTALSLNYGVPYVDGLKIGLNRVLYQNLEFFETKDLFRHFYYFANRDAVEVRPGVITNDLIDQMVSFSIDWKFKEVDARGYFEFARNDFSGSFRKYALEIDHSRAYTVGVEKAFDLSGNRNLYINYEHTVLGRNKGFLYQAVPPYYKHHINQQGYTHDGQIIGAGIGPGSNADNLNFVWYSNKGSTGFLLQRIRFDDDYFFNNILNRLRFDHEYSLGLNGSRFIKNWAVSAQSMVSYRFNKHYIEGNDKVNFFVSLSTKYFINK